ncbi:MAG: acyltransferase family protein [Rikenellaceae bacterium]
MKTRIIEIDQLKGLAMCLVVVWHVAGYVFGLNDDFVLLSRFIMPLFFFLSGLVSITEARPFNEFIPYLYKKSCSLLIPFFVVGTLFAHTQNVSIIGMLSTAFKCGYYYLLVLFIYSIILFFFNQVSAHITNRKVLNDLILSFSLFAITVVIEKIIKIYDVDMVSYTSIVQISKNILPFFLGVIVNKYKLLYFIKKELVFTLSLSIFGIFSYLNFCCDLHLHNVFYQIFS